MLFGSYGSGASSVVDLDVVLLCKFTETYLAALFTSFFKSVSENSRSSSSSFELDIDFAAFCLVSVCAAGLGGCCRRESAILGIEGCCFSFICEIFSLLALVLVVSGCLLLFEDQAPIGFGILGPT